FRLGGLPVDPVLSKEFFQAEVGEVPFDGLLVQVRRIDVVLVLLPVDEISRPSIPHNHPCPDCGNSRRYLLQEEVDRRSYQPPEERPSECILLRVQLHGKVGLRDRVHRSRESIAPTPAAGATGREGSRSMAELMEAIT